MIFAAAVLLTVGAIAYTLLVREKDLPQPDAKTGYEHLEERRARIYENLRDLQFEYRVGKLSDTDYLATKQTLQSELAGVLSEIDKKKGFCRGIAGAEESGCKGGYGVPALRHEVPGANEVLRRVRQGHGMRLAAVILALAPLYAAVDGTIVNATIGKPQANVVVSLVQPGKDGMQTLGSVKSDAQGKFQINKSGEGPQLVQALYDGVTYNKMLTPGAPVSGVQVEVFDVTKDVHTADVAQHILFIQPTADQLAVTEVYLVKNETKKTLNNAADGTLQFYVPGHTAQEGAVRVSVTAPGGMPVQRPAEATKSAGVYKVNFPVKPGETEFNITYALPAAKEFASKSVRKGLDTKLVVPRGITLEGAGITALGTDPSGKASLYSTTGQEYSFKIGGNIEASPGARDDDSGQPQITQTNPRLYGQLPIVLGLAIAILLLGLVVLYRSDRSAAKGKSRR